MSRFNVKGYPTVLLLRHGRRRKHSLRVPHAQLARCMQRGVHTGLGPCVALHGQPDRFRALS